MFNPTASINFDLVPACLAGLLQKIKSLLSPMFSTERLDASLDVRCETRFAEQIDDAIEHRGFQQAFAHESSSFLSECPVFSPATNKTRATAPRKNTVSPGTRIHLNVCSKSVCINSLLRAYQ